MVCMLASSMLLLLPGVACCGSEGESMLGGSGRCRCNARPNGSTFCADVSMPAAGARSGYAPADGRSDCGCFEVFDRVPVVGASRGVGR